MIYAYGVSLSGTYHIKNNIVCQDYYRILRVGKDLAFAAVADGLGSAAHSDVGSRIAATVSTDYCRKSITMKTDPQQILEIIHASFAAALGAVEKEAGQNDRSPDLYDTTLTLAVLIRDTLYYGHSGDSGMIALTAEGLYEQVTWQQRDQEGRVFPLFFTDMWEFKRFEKKVSSVLLATDGMLETFFPVLIKNDPVKIHVSLAQFFMCNRKLRIDKVGQEEIQAQKKDFIEKIPDEQVNDDKTVAVLINPSIKSKLQPKEYYLEPDWAELKRKHDEAWKREAYPGLYKTQNAAEEQKPTQHAQPHATPHTVQHATQQPATNPAARKPSAPQRRRKPSIPKIILLAAVPVLVVAGFLFAMLSGNDNVGENGPSVPVNGASPSPPIQMPESAPQTATWGMLESPATPGGLNTSATPAGLTSAGTPEVTPSRPDSTATPAGLIPAEPTPDLAASGEPPIDGNASDPTPDPVNGNDDENGEHQEPGSQ